MADIRAVMALSAGAAVLMGQRYWESHQRRQRYARLTAQRLGRQVRTELADLAERNRRLTVRIDAAQRQLALESRLPGAPEAQVGLDLLGEFYTLLLAELKRSAAEATAELEHQHGRRLAVRRAKLLALQREIRAVRGELEARQALWAGLGGSPKIRDGRGLTPIQATTTGSSQRAPLALVWQLD